MAGWRRAVELAMTAEEIETLTALSRSRTEAARRVERAQMLLAYRQQPSFFAVGQKLGVHHQTVQRCVERALAYGALAALDDRPRPGKEPTITPEAKAWLVSLACDKAKEHGYPHELWTTRLLARHARERGPAAGTISRPSGPGHGCCRSWRQDISVKARDGSGNGAMLIEQKYGAGLCRLQGQVERRWKSKKLAQRQRTVFTTIAGIEVIVTMRRSSPAARMFTPIFGARSGG